MHYQECQHENPQAAKYFYECAHKLEAICPECGKSTPPNSKFCNECAFGLSTKKTPTPKELIIDDKIEKIQKDLPKDLSDKSLSQRDKIEGNLKGLIVIFRDMEGLTFQMFLGKPHASCYLMKLGRRKKVMTTAKT